MQINVIIMNNNKKKFKKYKIFYLKKQKELKNQIFM